MGARSAERRGRATLRVLSLVGLPAVAVAAAIVPWPPQLVEQSYTNGIYPHIQALLTSLTNRIPFACLDLIAGGALLATVVRLVVTWRSRTGSTTWVVGRIGAALRLAAIVYLAFLGAWGCNYQRPPARVRFAVEASRITPARLRVLADRAVLEVNELFATRRDQALGWGAVQSSLVPGFDRAVRETGSRWTVVPGRPKSGLIPRTLPWAAVDGLVNPFGLEVLVNPEVLPFERHFVLAHEWAHLAGHADESDASFVGFLACLEGPPEARYSGWLALLLHAARALPGPERSAVLDRLGDGPRNDVEAIRSRLRHVRPGVYALSWRVYDQYLRANGVQSGIASYDEVIQLVLGARLTSRLAEPSAR